VIHAQKNRDRIAKKSGREDGGGFSGVAVPPVEESISKIDAALDDAMQKLQQYALPWFENAIAAHAGLKNRHT